MCMHLYLSVCLRVVCDEDNNGFCVMGLCKEGVLVT